MENNGRELCKSITQYLGDHWMTWVEQPLGSVWQNCPRADVLAIAKSYSPTIIRVYEVKISRSDFQRDTFMGKYKSYLPFCNYFYFATPAGMLKKDEIPEGCGLITFGDKGWRAVISPPKRDVTPSLDFLICLLMKGYQDNYEKYRDLEKKRLEENWQYSGLAAAARRFGREFAYDIAHVTEYEITARELKEKVEKIANREFADLGWAFQWLEREVDVLLGKHKYGKEASEVLELAMRLYGGSGWDIANKLREIAERLEPKGGRG